MKKCPICGSSAPHMHPAAQHEGEVQICSNDYHLTPSPQNKPEYIEAVKIKKLAEWEAHVKATAESRRIA